MKKIKTEGTEFFILASKSPLDKLIEFPLIVDDLWELKLAEIYQGEDVKLTVTRALSAGYGLLYWLYFKDSSSYKGLEDRISNDTYTDGDFEQSAKTQYQITWCPNCKREYHTLVMTPDDLYPGNPKLYRKKIEKFSPYLRCPACNSSFRQMVVKIISEVG